MGILLPDVVVSPLRVTTLGHIGTRINQGLPPATLPKDAGRGVSELPESHWSYQARRLTVTIGFALSGYFHGSRE